MHRSTRGQQNGLPFRNGPVHNSPFTPDNNTPSDQGNSSPSTPPTPFPSNTNIKRTVFGGAFSGVLPGRSTSLVNSNPCSEQEKKTKKSYDEAVAKIQALEAELEVKDSKLHDLNALNKSLDEKLASSNIVNDSLTASLKEKHAEVQRLNLENNDYWSKLEQTRDEKAKLKEMLDDYETLPALKNRLAEAEEKIMFKEVENMNLNAAFIRADNKCKGLFARLMEEQGDAQNNLLLNDYLATIAALQERLESQKRNMHELHEWNHRACEDMEERYDAEIATFRRDIEGLRNENKILRGWARFCACYESQYTAHALGVAGPSNYQSTAQQEATPSPALDAPHHQSRTPQASQGPTLEIPGPSNYQTAAQQEDTPSPEAENPLPSNTTTQLTGATLPRLNPNAGTFCLSVLETNPAPALALGKKKNIRNWTGTSKDRKPQSGEEVLQAKCFARKHSLCHYCHDDRHWSKNCVKMKELNTYLWKTRGIIDPRNERGVEGLTMGEDGRYVDEEGNRFYYDRAGKRWRNEKQERWGSHDKRDE